MPETRCPICGDALDVEHDACPRCDPAAFPREWWDAHPNLALALSESARAATRLPVADVSRLADSDLHVETNPRKAGVTSPREQPERRPPAWFKRDGAPWLELEPGSDPPLYRVAKGRIIPTEPITWQTRDGVFHRLVPQIDDRMRLEMSETPPPLGIVYEHHRNRAKWEFAPTVGPDPSRATAYLDAYPLDEPMTSDQASERLAVAVTDLRRDHGVAATRGGATRRWPAGTLTRSMVQKIFSLGRNTLDSAVRRLRKRREA